MELLALVTVVDVTRPQKICLREICHGGMLAHGTVYLHLHVHGRDIVKVSESEGTNFSSKS